MKLLLENWIEKHSYTFLGTWYALVVHMKHVRSTGWKDKEFFAQWRKKERLLSMLQLNKPKGNNGRIERYKVWNKLEKSKRKQTKKIGVPFRNWCLKWSYGKRVHFPKTREEEKKKINENENVYSFGDRVVADVYK